MTTTYTYTTEFTPISYIPNKMLAESIQDDVLGTSPTGCSGGSLYWDVELPGIYVFKIEDAIGRTYQGKWARSPQVEYHQQVAKTTKGRYFNTPRKFTVHGEDFCTNLWAKYGRRWYPVLTFNYAYEDQPCVFLP